MKMYRTTTGMVLGLALLACAVPGLAGETVELPAPDGRMWAPVGDVIGQTNNWTASFLTKDPHGNEAKGAEDWQLVQKYSGSGLFNWFQTNEDGKKRWFQGYGDNAGTGGLTGKVNFGCTIPGTFKWSIDFRNFDYFYDRTSEMRAPAFALPPAPPELPSLPEYNWRRGSFNVAYRPSDKFTVKAGYNRKCREGDKGSLLRGFGNNDASEPGRKTFDTTSNEIWGGVGFTTGKFGSDLNLAYRGYEGSRKLEGRHTYEDDQTRFAADLGLSYALNESFKLTGRGATSKLENKGSEATGSGTYDLNGETTTNSGQFGLLARLGKSANLSAGANFRNLETDARTSQGADIQQATDRKRDSQDYRLAVNYHGLAKTHLKLNYHYGSSNQDETVALDDVPGGSNVGDYQIIDQSKTQQDLGFHGRYRVGPAATIKASVKWQSVEIDQKDPATTGSVNPWISWMGDRNRDRLGWTLSLRTKPFKGVRFDIGHQSIDQTFERKDYAASETTWKASRGFANINWLATDILTVYGMFSYGVEEYALTGDPVPDTGMNAIAYDGTTMRFNPGATLRLLGDLDLEGHYEGVRFEDTANDDVIAKLQGDHDRLVLRAGYQLRPRFRVTASYTRNEFDENRWDDYIHHLYGLSVSGTF